MPISNELQQAIIKAMQAKGVNNTCPVCRPVGMSLLDNLGGLLITDDQGQGFNIGPVLKTALLKCGKCGNIQSLELGALGVQLK